MKELEDALKNPSIIHLVLCWPKAFHNSSIYSKTFTYCEKRMIALVKNILIFGILLQIKPIIIKKY